MKIPNSLTIPTHSRLMTATAFSLFALFALQACGGGGGGTPAIPTLSVTAASVVEGNSGSTTMANFVVTLSATAASDVTLTYSTSDNSATTADLDYVASAGATLVIPAGQTTGTISITVSGDDVIEADEEFNLQISNAQNATITGGSQTVTGTIQSDDTLAGYYTGDSSIVEVTGNPAVDLTGNIQVIANGISQMAVMDLANNLVYIVDLNNDITQDSFTALARVYKDGDFKRTTSVTATFVADTSIELTLSGTGDYANGTITLNYNDKNGDAAIDITSKFFWGSSTGGVQPISNSSINITTNNNVNSVNLRSCDINSVTLENVISEQTGRIRSFSIPSTISCITNTPLNGFITNFDTASPDDTMLFILFSDSDIHAATLQ